MSTLEKSQFPSQAALHLDPTQSPNGDIFLAENAARASTLVEVIKGRVSPTGVALEHGIQPHLDDDIAELNALLKRHQGAWQLGLSRVPQASQQTTEALFTDYETEPQASRLRRIALPTGRVTAANSLAFHSSGTIYKPVLDLRIQTSADRQGIMIPNDGTWFRFPFSTIQSLKLSSSL